MKHVISIAFILLAKFCISQFSIPVYVKGVPVAHVIHVDTLARNPYNSNDSVRKFIKFKLCWIDDSFNLTNQMIINDSISKANSAFSVSVDNFFHSYHDTKENRAGNSIVRSQQQALYGALFTVAGGLIATFANKNPGSTRIYVGSAFMIVGLSFSISSHVQLFKAGKQLQRID